VALAWVLRQPAVTAPIVGSTKLDHLDDAIAAVDLSLSDDEVAALEAPYGGHRPPSSFSAGLSGRR
jgi:aryl-alcohol dehydrogenase-like predicted oxidoreductase